MGLLDKFRNKTFPEWMRSMKAAEQIEKERQAALDSMKNLPPRYEWSQIRPAPVLNVDKIIRDFNRCHEFRGCSLVRNELRRFIKNPIKLKLPVRLKRKLRRDKAKYKQVREWLDNAEKAVNEALLGNSRDER